MKNEKELYKNQSKSNLLLLQEKIREFEKVLEIFMKN